MNNRLKTALFLVLLSALVIFVGSLFGKIGLIVALFLMLSINLVSYFYGDKLVLSLYNAKIAEKSKYQKLHQAVEELCKKAKLPKPKVYVIKTNLRNAFATGRNPKNASIAVTTGLLENLNYEELKGVIGHELMHIKNRDVLIATIVAVLAGAIMFIANIARYSLIFSSFEERSSNNIIALLLVSILAPIAALLIQLAISRSRELIADEGSARLLKDGKPLANALIKLEKGPKLRAGTEASSHLFIVNPLKASGISNLFSTHPPTEQRIRRLLSMKF